MNEKELDKILQEIKELLIVKNKKYGEKNILKFGEKGVVVRSSDKIERLIQLVWNNEKGTNDENIDDTWKDLAGYVVIGLMVQRKVFE